MNDPMEMTDFEREELGELDPDFARVFNEDGMIVAEVNTALLNEYFEDVVNEGNAFDVLTQLKPSAANKIVGYLTYRIMEIHEAG